MTTKKPTSPWMLGGRAILAAGLLWAAWRYTLPTDATPDNPVQEARQQASEHPELEAPLLLFSDLMNGSWRFADMPWDTSWTTPAMNDDQLAKAPRDMRKDLRQRDIEGRIIELAKSIAPAAEDATPYVRYRGSLGNTKFALYTTRRGDQELIEEARINYQHNGAAGTFVLRPSDIEQQQVDTTHSLRFAPPLPADASILATRHVESGEAMGLIAETSTTMRENAKLWQAAGWRVEASSAIPESEAVICEKDGRAWSAWRMAAEEDQATLLLIRIPDRNDASR